MSISLVIGACVIIQILLYGVIYVLSGNTNFLAFANDPKNSSFFSALSGVGGFFQAVAAFLNILVISYFYKIDKTTRLKEQETNNKLYWFKTFILEKHFNDIEAFFAANHEIIESCRQITACKSTMTAEAFERGIKGNYGLYTDQKILVSSSFIDILHVSAPSLGKEIDELFDRFQDEFNQFMLSYTNNEPKCDYVKFKTLVAQHKKTLLEALYKYWTTECS